MCVIVCEVLESVYPACEENSVCKQAKKRVSWQLCSPRHVTFLDRPTLGMFSTLPVLLYFFQIERIVDSGICNNFTISQFLCPSRFKSTTSCFRSSLSCFDLRHVCLFVNTQQMTLKLRHIFGESSKRYLKTAENYVVLFITMKNIGDNFNSHYRSIAAIFLFSRILMRQHYNLGKIRFYYFHLTSTLGNIFINI